MVNNLDQILMERSCRYGNFIDVAQRSNNIFASILNGAPQLPSTTPLYREALHMICTKLARLVTGGINDLDSWQDIAGYAMLVHNQIAHDIEASQASPEAAPRKPDNPFANNAVIDAMEEQLAKELREGI